MRKLFSILAVALFALSAHATERIVWAGNKPISYNQTKYIGTTLEIYNLQGLAVGDIIKVYGTPKIAEDVEYVLQYKEGNNWTWTDLSTSVENNVCTYEVADAAIAGYIEERGLIVTGQGYDVTKVAIATSERQKEIWRKESLRIYYSSNDDKYAFDSRDSAVNLSSARPGYKLKVYTETSEANPNYQMQYKDGDEWTWTPIADAVDAHGVMAYTIETMDKCQKLRDRGLVVNGNGYSINRISLETAAKYTLWEGEQKFTSWQWLYGAGFLQTDIDKLEANDKLIITISGTAGEDRQLNVRNKVPDTDADEDTEPDVITLHANFLGEGAQTLEVTLTEADVTSYKTLGTDGIILTGTGCTVTKVEIQKAGSKIEERTLWLNHGKQISWSNTYYPGEQFYTNGVIDFSGVREGTIIRLFVTAGLYNPNYTIKDRSGNEWGGENLVINTTGAPVNEGKTGEIVYQVPADKANVIAERGLIITGQGYNIDRIVIEVPATDLILSDADPAASLTRLKGLAEPVDMTINRTLYRDGYFNTLCLPFDLNEEQIAASSLAGAEIMEFANAYLNGEGDAQTLDLRFAPVSTIEAGKPYLIRFANTNDQLDALSFYHVIVTKEPSEELTVEGASMNFVGIFAPTHLSSSNNLFLGANDELYWMNAADETSLQGFRAYFVAPAAARNLVRGKRARIVTRENAPTGLSDVQTTVRGTKVMKDGQLFIIYEGKTYNAQGQTIR